MLGGTYGKILHVNLTTGSIYVERPPDDFYRLLVGGRAVIAYFLLRDLPANTDPFSPENILIFAPGILQGSNLPGSGRHAVGGKSPLTGAIGSSEAGGWWGHEFKRTGYDALIIHGRSEKPVYLSIHNEEVIILPADHLWGLPTAEVQSTIRIELGDERIRVAQIGCAGENLVRYSAIIHDVNRAAGRNGMGALMGSKNLKAVAVRGTKSPTIIDRSRLQIVAKWLGQVYKELCAWAAIGRGTQDSVMNWGFMGGLPTHNYCQPMFNERDLISGERNYEMYLKARDTCQVCPIYCKQVFENDAEDERHRLNPVYGGAEYEAMGALGSSCGVSDNLAVLKANELCNKYGLDTISTGMSIAFVMDCFEHGFLSSADTDGLEFRWGDGDLVVRVVEMIAKREGFGDTMAEGVARMSVKFGPQTEPLNLTVKGQELPMHEPRLKHVLGLGYAVAPVGADHEMNVHDTDYVKEGLELDRVNTVLETPIGPISNTLINEDKMLIFFHELNWRHYLDCAVACHFYPYSYHHMADALSGVTGIEYNIHDILAVGERAQTLSRLFNLREGFTEDDDRLPKRVMEAFSEGPLAGVEIKPETFEWAKRRFYEMMLWDPETGIPTRGSLARLQLEGLMDGII
jgi:aldehyde:ferredoxin oxidoreductase